MVEGGAVCKALTTVELEDQPMDVDFHPELLATGVIDGWLHVHSTSAGGWQQKYKLKAHSSSCRAVRFGRGGDLLYSASTDQSILALDVATGKPAARKQARSREAHDTAINRLAAVSETMVASGDDEGIVKLWDKRQPEAVAMLEAHTDYVSDLCLHEPEACLLSVSGDGTLAVLDVRRMKVKAASEGDADDELLSVAPLKGGRKVVCGSTSGVLNIWSWGYWNDCSDRFPGHPDSVAAMLAYDQDSIITGSGDGMIRILSVQPNKLLGVLGEHADYPIERLAMSADRQLLASASHDDTVKVWDLSVLEEEEEVGEEQDEEEAGPSGQATDTAAPATQQQQQHHKRAAAGSDDSDGDSGDSDSGDKRKRHKKRKGQHRIPSKQQHKRSSGSGNFFAGLL